MLSEEDTSTLVEQTHNNSYHTFTGTEEVDLIYRYVCVLFVGNLTHPSTQKKKKQRIDTGVKMVHSATGLVTLATILLNVGVYSVSIAICIALPFLFPPTEPKK